ncbi:MAG TPA: carboxypeptidase regulatory-like domain-containing protein, partial [Bacteroidota bacterium]
QHACEFVPHVLILCAPDRLEVVNNDPVLHNVHAYDLHAENLGLFNLAQPIKGQKSTVAPSQFRNASLIMTGCDAGHPWMNGYIIRAEHPYYALTGADGSFRLDNVPPGSYRLVMWHEGVAVTRTDREKGVPTRYTYEAPYRETAQVTVSPKSRTQADFELKLR